MQGQEKWVGACQYIEIELISETCVPWFISCGQNVLKEELPCY